MKLAGYILLVLVPLSAVAKSDYRGPINLIGATQDSRADIETCIASRSEQLKNVTYTVAPGSSPNQSIYTYKVKGQESLRYRVAVTDVSQRRVLYIAHEYSDSTDVKSMDDTLIDCASVS